MSPTSVSNTNLDPKPLTRVSPETWASCTLESIGKVSQVTALCMAASSFVEEQAFQSSLSLYSVLYRVVWGSNAHYSATGGQLINSAGLFLAGILLQKLAGKIRMIDR